MVLISNNIEKEMAEAGEDTGLGHFAGNVC